MNPIAATPEPPYYAVIFTSLLSGDDLEGYGRAADRMFELARSQPGYLGFETARGEDGPGITVSYWESLEAIAAWKRHAEHAEVQRRGRNDWYRRYAIRICRVESQRDFEATGEITAGAESSA